MFLNDPTVEHKIDYSNHEKCNCDKTEENTNWIPDWHWTVALLILLSLEEDMKEKLEGNNDKELS